MIKESFLEHFDGLNDPRKNNHNKRHELKDILIITILAVICGADTWIDIEYFGKCKQEWLQKFLTLPNGIPSHDTINRVFSLLSAKQFEECFLNWINSLVEVSQGEIISIDGKTVRGSRGKNKAIHMVSAWANKNQMVLGQRKVDGKSNEITAVPELLKQLDITDCIITIDAMGCQRKIANQIKEQTADYVLAVKDNQKKLHQAMKKTFEFAEKKNYEAMVYSEHEIVEGDHGRIETRRYVALPLMYLWQFKLKWKGLKSLVMVDSERVDKSTGEIQKEKRYYISSLSAEAKKLGEAIRLHWGVENGLHWSLDVSFNEDQNRTRTGNAAENLSIVRRIALNLLKADKTVKAGIVTKRKKAGWDHRYLATLLHYSKN